MGTFRLFTAILYQYAIPIWDAKSLVACALGVVRVARAYPAVLARLIGCHQTTNQPEELCRSCWLRLRQLSSELSTAYHKHFCGQRRSALATIYISLEDANYSFAWGAPSSTGVPRNCQSRQCVAPKSLSSYYASGANHSLILSGYTLQVQLRVSKGRPLLLIK